MAYKWQGENVRQPSPKLVKVGVLLGTLGLVLALVGCSGDSESGWFSYAELREAGVYPAPDLALIDTLHFHRAGAQAVLSYDWAADAFTGTVENTTKANLGSVRVEVHLSNEIRLGPSTPVDLAPGQVVEIILPAGSQPLTYLTLWSAYLEVG